MEVAVVKMEVAARMEVAENETYVKGASDYCALLVVFFSLVALVVLAGGGVVDEHGGGNCRFRPTAAIVDTTIR